MPKQRTPALADWIVSLHPVPGASTTEPLSVRATSLKVREASYVLEDASGSPVFAAPVTGVRYVKIKGPEDSEHVPARKEPAPPADPVTAAVAGRAAGEAEPRPPLPRRTTGKRAGK